MRVLGSAAALLTVLAAGSLVAQTAPAPSHPVRAAVPARLTATAPTPAAAAPSPAAARGIVWRALDALAGAQVEAPRLVPAYRALVRGRTLRSRNPYAAHRPPLDRVDLYVTRLMSGPRRAFETRHALYLPPPARARFGVSVPAGAVLRLAVARSGRATQGQVLVDGGVVWEGPLPMRWREVRVDLSRFAGRRVQVDLVTRGRGHAFFADPALEAPRAGGPNVLVLVVDTLSTWALGCYGQKLPITPTMDRLCAEGTVFEQAIANANWTRPSMLSFLSSWLPGRVGISYDRYHGLDIGPQRSRFYESRPDMLPILMRRGGYRTAAIVNNLFLTGYHRYGVDTGFEQVVDYRRHVADTVDITRRTIRWLRQNRDQRFFLLLNYNAPHVPYAPPARYRRQVRAMNPRLPAKLAAYLGEVRYTDAEIGRLLRAMRRLGLDRSTVVILTADHGEVFERSHAYRVVRTGRYSRHSHAVTMYDEEVRVPLIVRQPGTVPAGKRVADQVRLLDLAPSVLEAARLPASPKHQGRSFGGLVRGQRESGQRVAFIEGRRMRAVRAGGFKYFWRLPGFDRIAQRGRVTRVPAELYDLARDPGELRNLADDPAHAATKMRLHALLKKIEGSEAIPAPAAPAPPPSATPVATVAGGGRHRFHLRFVGDKRRRRFEGRIWAPGGVRSFRLFRPKERDAIWRGADGGLRFRVEVNGDADDLWAEVDAATEVHLEVNLDGAGPAPLRVGPFGLPLVDAGRIAGPELALLDARRAPPTRPGRELGVFLWRQRVEGGAVHTPTNTETQTTPSAAADEAGAGRSAPGEVENVLRDWGYIQGGKKRSK